MHETQRKLSTPEKVPVIYVTSTDALAACINHLEQENIIALDLEFDQDNYTYGSSLCLMQIASRTHCYLIDPKAELDISFIFPVMENTMIQKVLHSSSEDLRLLHSLKCIPKNLVDTEHYAKLLNYERTSLGAMLQQLFGIELDKKMQKVNWELRPLLPKQLDYAANDVMYLLQLKYELEKEAVIKNLQPFINEENSLLSTTIHNPGLKDNFLKKKDLLYLSPYHQFVLNGLLGYRDKIAKQQNKPAYFVMKEETVKDLASNKISQVNWQTIKGIHPVLKTEEGEGMLFTLLEQLQAEAKNKNLSFKRSRNDISDEDFQNEKIRREHVKASIFTPIQNEISARFGEHAMRFIFSSTTANAIILGQLKIGELKAQYRKTMIKNIAQKLGIDISSYE